MFQKKNLKNQKKINLKKKRKINNFNNILICYFIKENQMMRNLEKYYMIN